MDAEMEIDKMFDEIFVDCARLGLAEAGSIASVSSAAPRGKNLTRLPPTDLSPAVNHRDSSYSSHLPSCPARHQTPRCPQHLLSDRPSETRACPKLPFPALPSSLARSFWRVTNHPPSHHHRIRARRYTRDPHTSPAHLADNTGKSRSGAFFLLPPQPCRARRGSTCSPF